MNKETIYIIIIVLVIIFIIKLLTIRKSKLEHLTPISDEAIQNLSSLYNKDQLSITNLTATGNTNLNNTAITNVKTNKLQLGDKWLFSGVGDAGANDDWLRLLKTDGSNAYYGGLAAGRLYDARIGDLSSVVTNLQNQINSLQAQVNQRVVIGGRYGFHRGHDNSVIWGHGVILQPCGLNGCPGCPNNCTAG